MRPQNVMEDLVKNALDEQIDSLGLECTCEKCRNDILALALNELPPHYVVKEEGNLFIKAKFLENQNRTNILCAITKAAEIVKNNIRHA